MRPCLATATLAFILGTAASAAQPVHLQALTPTSGAGAEQLLDGDAATGWRLAGDSADEGVLLRLERPVSLDGLSVRACPGAERVKLQVDVDTASQGHVEATAAQDGVLKFQASQEVRSLFLRLQEPTPAKVCLGEVRLLQGGQPLDVKPPRTLKGTVKASSVLMPAEAYHPSYLFDGRPDFGWVEGAKGTGQGESITLTLEAPAEVVALELWNGYQRSEDHFRKNARAGRLALSVDGGAPVSLAVKDASGPQTLKLPAPVKGTTFTLTVEKALAGKKYPDLVLSELRLVDKQGPLTVRTPDLEERTQALAAKVASTPLTDVVDRSWSNRCEPLGADSSRRLRLRTNHTFVIYENATQGDNAIEDVADGTWVMQKSGNPWTTVEVFGRRHRSEVSWEPYSSDVPKDTTRIIGGKLEIARVRDLSLAEFQKTISGWKSGDNAIAGCVDAPEGQEGRATYKDLVKQGAIIVRGTALSDIMVP